MKVFVYGTLKQGYGNHRLLTDAEYLGPAVTTGKFLMIGAGFPVVMKSEDGLPVTGEVYEIGEDGTILANLDALEGEGSMYDREVVEVQMGDETYKVSMYIGTARMWGSRFTNTDNTAFAKDGVLEWSHRRAA